MWQASGEFCRRLFGGFEKRGSAQSKGEKSSSSLVLSVSKGRRKHMVPFKTTPFLLFKKKKCMKQRRFSQNAPFHLNGNWRQNMSDANSSLQFARFFSFWSLVSNFFN
jgi:hypothetical protein